MSEGATAAWAIGLWVAAGLIATLNTDAIRQRHDEGHISPLVTLVIIASGPVFLVIGTVIEFTDPIDEGQPKS